MDYWRTYYAMKHRRGGEKLPPKWYIKTNVYYPCPGFVMHPTTYHRKKILFAKYSGLNNNAAIMYWRSHKDEHKSLLKILNSRKAKHKK